MHWRGALRYLGAGATRGAAGDEVVRGGVEREVAGRRAGVRAAREERPEFSTEICVRVRAGRRGRP